MKRYAVAYYDFDHELKAEIVEANTWRGALQDAFGVAQHLPAGDNLETLKQEAADQDWMFDIVEIP